MNAFAAVLEGFSNCRILVVGDLMLDRYISGGASRLSPEAPVPVVLQNEQHDSLGGAANVARNICALGAKCDLAGFIGIDEPGESLENLCRTSGIGTEAISKSSESVTTCKTRILAAGHQLLRVDRESSGHRSAQAYDDLFEAIVERVAAARYDAIVVSDYAKGVTEPKFMSRLNELARQREIPVFVDPKGTDYTKYTGAAMIKPNRLEMAEFARRWGWPEHDLVSAAKMLRSAAEASSIVLTLGEGGLELVTSDGEHHVPTRAKEVFDVTGAGDTVMAALVLAISAGVKPELAADVANHAAAIVIARVGSSAVTLADLTAALISESGGLLGRKVYDLQSLGRITEQWRADGKKVVFTNGCFDILHAGHAGLLHDAKALGDFLIVGLNSDASISRLKGPTRPLISLDQRAAVLAALESVDAIVVYEEDTPLEAIKAVKPDILVKGGDYDRSTVVGADLVEANGGRVAIVPITIQVSTTRIAQAIQQL